MKTDYVKKGLAIGVIILFVCVGISSAVANKGVDVNNNDVINFSDVESAEDLPDLIVVDIQHDITNMIPYITWATFVRIQNIGDGSINGYVNYKLLVYRGIGSSSILIDTVGPYLIELNIAPGEGKWLESSHSEPDGGHFYKLVVYVNYDENVNESDYHNNVAQL
jgi:hypothetical protein